MTSYCPCDHVSLITHNILLLTLTMHKSIHLVVKDIKQTVKARKTILLTQTLSENIASETNIQQYENTLL